MMEVLQNDRSSSKLPPSSIGSLRKSVIKISSPNSTLDDSHQRLKSITTSGNNERTRILPIYHRSISHNDNNLDNRLSSYHQQFNYKSPFNRINFTISSSSDPFTRGIGQRLSERCHSASSGYDSNIGSSWSSESSNPLMQSLDHYPLRIQNIRRTSSANRLSSGKPKEINNDNNLKQQSSKKMLRQPLNRHSFNENTLKENVLRTLDQVEKRIDFYREIAFELSEEKSKLLDALHKISNNSSLNTFTEVDLQDLQANVEHLSNRLNSVDIKIRPVRSSDQIEAFERANQCIDGLNRIMAKEGKLGAKKRCLSYISSCSSDDWGDSYTDTLLGPIDERFQKMVIECSLEDQKAIKKRLKSLLEQIENGGKLKTSD